LQESAVAQIIKSTQTGLTRIFAKFGRTNQRQNPASGNHWYDCDVCSRGL
jgi:hypothetical protein